MTKASLSRPLRLAGGLVLVLALAACSGFAGAPAPSGLPAGLSARMDQPRASLDRAEALALVNAYRASVGAVPLAADAGLDSEAQALATAYATTGVAPRTPQSVAAMRLSAGYASFADTFSGWRNSAQDAAVLGRTDARRAGLGVAFNPASTYGVHWVLLLAD